jgi:antitoxin HicB
MTDTHSTHLGSSFDDFLREQELYEEVTSVALTRVLAWQLKEEMQRLGISKVEMAERMGTSRSQLDRLLESASSGVSIDTLFRAAKALNRELQIRLV